MQQQSAINNVLNMYNHYPTQLPKTGKYAALENMGGFGQPSQQVQF